MPLIEIEEAADKRGRQRGRGGKGRRECDGDTQRRAAQQGEGVAVAVAVAVAVVAADKQRQQQHYTHHYVERFSVIDDMGPFQDCLEIPEEPEDPDEVPPAPLPSLCATLQLSSEGETQSRRHIQYTHTYIHTYVCSSCGAPHKNIKFSCA